MNLPTGTAPWQQGQATAYALREKWQLDSEPVSDEMLADRLRVSVEKLRDVNEKAPFSFALGGISKLGFVLNRPNNHGRRFDLARLVGDYVGFEVDEPLRPATLAWTNRQKFQRAFAAEFLCPSEMIRERFAGKLDPRRLGDTVAELSAEYNVSEQLIVHHMENRKVLPSGVLQGSLLLA